MEEGKMPDHLTSAAAFVEGGIQDACDDACSICLEVFCDSDPSTLTTCKHKYHLQCILEWCQRSSQCPMCWQAISLKDPGSQELLDAVENERNIRMNPPRNTTIFHHPTLGDFELQHLPVSANDSELEERIIQHLAAAAAMGRARQLARREGQRGRSSGQGRPRYLVFSTQPDGSSNAGPAGSVSLGSNQPPAVMIAGPNPPFITIGEDSAELIARPNSPQADQLMATPTRSSAGSNRTSSSNRSPSQNSPSSHDRAGPSDFQAFSESVKSRLSALSVRCKESITKNTRGWKDRLFTRNSSTPDPSAEVCAEVDQRPATVSRMMDHLQIGEEGRTNIASGSNNLEGNSTRDLVGEPMVETLAGPSVVNRKPEASCATGSSSN